MIKRITLKEITMLSLFMAIAWSAAAQMKVGDNPNSINKGSILELEAKDKGVLYPRVALTASNTWKPLQGTAVAGMTVYNTATVTATTSSTTSLSPGFYFWQGDKWNKLATGEELAESGEWADGTVSGTAFIYANQAKTTGNDVVITDSGHVGIGTKTPGANLTVRGKDGENAEIVVERFNDDENGANLTLIKSGGTAISPQGVTVGQSLGRFRTGGYSGYPQNNVAQVYNGFDGFASNIETTVAAAPTASGHIPTNMKINLTQSSGVRRTIFTMLGDNGYVGVGTTPTEKLEVAGNIKATGLKGTGDRVVIADANGVLKAGTATVAEATSKWTNDATNNMVKLTNLSDGTTARTEDKNIFIADDGKIGVGTATSQYKFAVESSGKDYTGSSIEFKTYRDFGAVGLDFFRARGTKEAPLSVTDGDGLGVINSFGYNGSGFKRSAALMFSVEGTPNADFIPAKFDIGFQRQATGGNLKNGFVSVFHISNSGNTGIGTITPTEKLEVAGNIKATGLKGTGDRVVIADANGVLKAGTATVAQATSKWTNDATNKVVKLTNLSDGTTARTEDKNIFVSDDGKIGVGTATPTQSLEVAGNVKAISFMAANMQTFPDYVFETYYNGTSELNNEYGFMSLEEVEAFTKANNHLPGYKSARVVAHQGSLDIVSTQIKNVEKIEELYLHTIEQEKEIKNHKEALQEKEAKIKSLEARLERLEKLLVK